jgi:hypothetical protein
VCIIAEAFHKEAVSSDDDVYTRMLNIVRQVEVSTSELLFTYQFSGTVKSAYLHTANVRAYYPFTWSIQ